MSSLSFQLFMMTDQNGDFNNMFRASTPNQHNLVSLLSSFNNSINQQQNVSYTDEGKSSGKKIQHFQLYFRNNQLNSINCISQN